MPAVRQKLHLSSCADFRSRLSHTTASDALWSGLPVLTQIGQTFAGRVAASLLNAIGLAELITHSPEEYEALALELTRRREKLGNIRAKLDKNRLTTPLFDTATFARHIEAAYAAMYQRHQSGLPPRHIEVQQQASSEQGERTSGADLTFATHLAGNS